MGRPLTTCLTKEVRAVRRSIVPLAGVTQLVEYLLPKQAVAGSSPVARLTSIFRIAVWGCSSAWLECRSVTPEVAGSSPVSPAPVHNRTKALVVKLVDTPS